MNTEFSTPDDAGEAAPQDNREKNLFDNSGLQTTEEKAPAEIPREAMITPLKGIEWYAAWLINRGIRESENYSTASARELCYLDYAKLHKLLYYTVGIILAEYNYNILADYETIHAHECGAIIHSLGRSAARFGYNSITTEIFNDGILSIPLCFVDVMEDVYKNLGRLDKRSLMRLCKKDGLWKEYAAPYNKVCAEGDTFVDPYSFPEIEIDSIKKHFLTNRANYFYVDGGISESREVRDFEAVMLSKSEQFKDTLNKRDMSDISRDLAVLCQMRGYSNISSDGKTKYRDRIIELKNALCGQKSDITSCLVSTVDKYFAEAIKPCIEYLVTIRHAYAPEFVFCRARNNIEALYTV